MKNRILVVDDDHMSRTLLRDILVPEGYQVREADDGELALEFLGRESFDLMILDRAMPRLGGLELLQALQKKKMTLPVLMISAYGEEALWGKAISLGAQDYLVKPFDGETVLNAVKKCLK